MIRTTKTAGLMLASGLTTLALMQPASALEAQAFIDRFEAVYAVMGYDLDFGTATLNGDTVTVDGVTVGFAGPDAEGMEPTTFDVELTFTGVVENEDGSYYAEQLTVPDIDTEFAQDPVGHVSLTGMVAEGLWLPPEGETGAEFLLQTVERVATGPLVVSRAGEEVIRYDGLDYSSEFAFDAEDALESISSTFTVSNIWADLSTVGEEQPGAGAVIEALGLTTIDGNISQSGTWTLADGHLALEESLLDFANVGKLNFTFDITGFTTEVLDKIYAMNGSDIDPTTEEGQAQQMMMGMEMAQALSISGATIRYDDAGLAPKLLDLFAAQSGTDRAAFVEGIKPVVPAMMADLNAPALVDLVVPAVNAFLDNPQSFEVAVAPASPTSFLVLAAAAANPAGLIQALGLTVTANQ
ncbi:hypothetical protein [Devosia rhizoryzae]|uniref:DUF945 domain-containing protein n=1 Tax=Devosia rhizoryzae TaxID=2774137 RepID=A0ABX7C6F2_9HYPH|nr:hypothetical protein [Devosia rhizoryzae]QQR39681.1 hypothetical protein JI748_01275 [Devosia rhizoryzae]